MQVVSSPEHTVRYSFHNVMDDLAASCFMVQNVSVQIQYVRVYERDTCGWTDQIAQYTMQVSMGGAGRRAKLRNALRGCILFWTSIQQQ